MTKEFLMHCDYCGKKVVVRDRSTLKEYTEIPQAPIPGGIPDYIVDDKKNSDKKTNVKKAIPRRKMFKCSICGRGIILRQSMIPTLEEIKKNEEENHGIGCETSVIRQQISDIFTRPPTT